MFGFSKHCPICGMDVTKEISIKRFGKHFCSNSCVEKYLQIKAKEKLHPRRGGCC
jgi:endogenous inhibitor of DNA gyrase (YacG/DUF329 family)